MQELYQKMESESVFSIMQNTTPGDINELKVLLLSFPKDQNKLIIFDDMMHDIDRTFSEVFTVIGHHYNASVIFTTQSLFFAQTEFRTMSLNAHYIFLCKSPRNSSQIIQLAKQIYPYKTKFLIEAFFEATKKPYTYLLLDLHQSTPDHLRIKSKIFMREWPMELYLTL
jgi:hypothetical protein